MEVIELRTFFYFYCRFKNINRYTVQPDSYFIDYEPIHIIFVCRYLLASFVSPVGKNGVFVFATDESVVAEKTA